LTTHTISSDDETGARGRMRSRGAWVFVILLLALCAVQIWLGQRIAGQVNFRTDEFDQGAYVLMAQKMKGSLYPWYSDGTRNPLVPWLAQMWADPDSEGFFEAAKRMNVWIGGLGTLVVGWIFVRRAGFAGAFAGAAVAGGAILLPSSTFLGAETLFFVLFLAVFVWGVGMFRANPLWSYAVFGLLAGAAYLAKPSASPFVAMALGLGGVRAVWEWVRPADGRWRPSNALLGILVFAAGYLPVVAPRMVHAHATWGSPFYSLPSCWFWADSWEDCVTKYTDCRAATIAAMPPAQRPTVSGYFMRHSVSDAVRRVLTGAGERARQFVFPEKKFRIPFDGPGKPRRAVLPYRGLYVTALGLLAVVMGLFAWRAVGGAMIGRGMFWAGLLFLATWAVYLAAMGWYLPTGPGHRFILTLYLPTLWVFLTVGERWRRASGSPPAGWIFLAGCLLASGLVMWRFLAVLPSAGFEKILYTF